jgi:hypothetical protein
MKKLSYSLIGIVLLSVSCTRKIDNVYFHGRVTLDCNNQPAKRVGITIKRLYDTGQEGIEQVGTAVTNDDGYYSFVADVWQRGTFYGYELSVYAGGNSSFHDKFFGTITSMNNSKNIAIDYQARPLKAYGLHIKNTSPTNSMDVFNSLIVSRENGKPTNETVIFNISGSNVDTTIYSLYASEITYKYSFTKNGILTERIDSISNPNCLDTLIVNVFY